MNRTGIEYLDYTWNITHGCTKTSPGCANCWAERTAHRLAAMGSPGYDPAEPFRVTYHENRLNHPLGLKTPARIGVSFMGDLFHPMVAVETIRRVFRIIFMAEHTFFILTKRPDRMLKILGMLYENSILMEADNVWFGVSAESQAEADQRIPLLLRLPVTNRWVSVEPMLGPVDLYRYLVCESCIDPSVCWCADPRIKWVVCGCESGPGARPMSPDWARDLADRCRRAGTPFMLKQMMQDGRKVSAPYLDGRQHMGMPV